MMTALQRQGAININFVTPSHVVPQILEALPLAYAAGLRIPLVYNSSAYDSPAALSLLDRLIDIYLPDAKLMDRVRAKRWCQAEDYPDVARLAIKTMHDQVGDLVVDDAGVAQRGLLVRHLLLPHGGSDTEAWMEFLARDVSRQTYVNIMDQYAPCGRVALRPLDFPDLQGWVSPRELTWAYGCARRCGLTRLDGFLSP
jgi:putative pyruvate formate lyase activating enzyme